MKLLFNITILFFLSASAFLFFTKNESILLNFAPAQEEEPGPPPGAKTGAVEKPAPYAGTPFAPGFAVPLPVTAIKAVDKTTAAAGDLLSYTIVVSNPGSTDVAGLSFSDDIDPNTTLVDGSLKTSPVPVNDSYTSLGNVGISVPAGSGILVNDYLGVNPPASFTAVSNAATTGGGSISIAADGSFTYTPAAGFTGNDTYQYSLSNTVGTATATITIAVATMVWFINNTYSGTAADGRLATPFKSIADFQAVNDGVGLHPNDNQAIFVYESATAYSGNITLRNGQKLIGQDATTDLPTILSFTTPTYSFPTLPVLNSAAPAVTLTATGATNIVTLNGGASGTYTIRGLTIGDKGTGSGISGTNFGTLNVSEASITGTGQGLALTTGTLNATLASISSSSGVNGISLTGIAGSLTANAGALSGHTGVSFLMSGGTGSVTYNGTVAKTSAGNIIDIQNKTGGTVDFNGGVTASASGGILLNNNTGATFSFDGGLNLSTATGAAFTATAGGTVTASQNNTTIVNQVTTSSGAAINIANTTIGAAGVTFRSINVNGASKGIILNNTGSGGFSITGTGTTAGSGGTIQNTPVRGIEITSAQNITLNYLNLTSANTTDGGGAGVCDETNNIGCNAALYIKDATTVSVTGTTITTTEEQGINLHNVSGLTISGCTVQGNGNALDEGALKARNLLGNSTITNSVFKNAAHRIAHIINTTGTAHLAVSNSSFINEASNTSPVKEDCFEMRIQAAAQATVVITNSVFKRAGTKAIQIAAEGNSTTNLAITGCTVDREGTLMAGIEVIADGATAKMNANVDGNPLVTGDREVPLNFYSGTNASMQATARNNVGAGNTASIQGGNNPNQNAFATLRGFASQESDSKVSFLNNSVSNTDELGIQVASAGINSGSSISGEVAGNTLITNNIAGNLSLSAIDVSAGAGSTSVNTSCAYVRNNSLTISATDGAFPKSFRVRVAGAASSVTLQGTGTNTAQVWTNNGNTSSPTNLVQDQVALGGTINYSTVPCPTPSNLTVPTSIVAADLEIEATPAIAAAVAPAEVEEEMEEELERGAQIERKTGYGLTSNQPVEEILTFTEAENANNTLATTSVTPQNVSVSGITLQPSQSLSIQFQVTVNDPFPDGVCQVSNQGSVSGTNITTVLTDNDANAGNGINPTVTAINSAPSITTCQANITTATDAGLCTASESFSVSVKGCPEPTITYKIGNTPITSPHNFPAGITTVDVTVSNGVGTDVTCQFTVTVTSTAPVVNSVSVPANGTYALGQNLDFTINFSEAITVNTAGGVPRLALTIGAQTRYADYLSGSGSSALVFRYTVASGDEDINGITVGTLSANGGTLESACGTSATLTLNNVGSTAAVLVDGVVPTVTINQAAGQADPTNASPINFTVVFSEAVTGFINTDVSLSSTAGAVSATVTPSGPNDGTTYTVAVSGMTIEGTVSASIAANMATDAAGNGNTASTSTDNTVAFILCTTTEITSGPGAQSANECSATLVSFSVTAVGDNLSYEWKVDGNTVGTNAATLSYNPSGLAAGAHTVTVYVSGDCGTDDASATLTVIADNVPPVISSVTSSPATLWPPNHKMRDVTISVVSTDNCGTSTCQITSVASNEAETGTGDGDRGPDWEIVDATHVKLRAEKGTAAEQRVYTITVTCTDGKGNTSTGTTTVVIAHNITAPQSGASFKIGSTVPFAGTFWDIPGNRHTAKWLIDGSTTVKGTVTEPSGSKNGKVTGSYKFGAAGVYKLQMNITDQNGVTSYANTAGDLDAIVVIYDPNGGYTYGGGHFASPAGALTGNSTATGKVSYGFTVNYFKGATLPKGETQFEFKVGELEYNALNFDYLAIEGARAQFKGSGKIIGGQSGINFIMTVIDGALDGTGVDKVRIKIYNKNTGYVYYDNEPGLSEADDPTTRVGNGSQVVIKGASVQKGAAVTNTESLQEPETLQLRVLPNPTRGSFNVFVESDNKRDRITLQVFDQWGRKVEQRVVASELTRIGEAYRAGTYFIRVVQAGKHREAKLLRLPD